MRPLRIIFALTPLVFALVAFIFSILTLTSKKWALRNSYDESLLVSQWDKPIYTLSRSPFAICSATANIVNETTTTYSISCEKFRAYGSGKTSCEALLVTQNDTAPNTGDIRLCQQIHLAGNFAIASTAFIAFGFSLTIILVLLSVVVPSSADGGEPSADGGEPRQETTNHHNDKPHERTKKHYLAVHLNFLAVVFLLIGAVLGVISQFYGVLGFIQSAPNNAEFAAAGSTDTSNGSHGPWFEGPGLSTFCTVAWAFALGGGFLAARVWRLPAWERIG